jgi:hydroxymethylpyrimidine/phosphomethylpyrimidine kinase
MKIPPVVLTIAGFDPSSGAGITADIKTIAAHACYGVACITALTVQSTAGVRRVQALPEGLIKDTLRELADDIEIAAVRIGMLGSQEAAYAVAEFLSEVRLSHVVLDPIVQASSGADLLGPGGLKVILERLIPLSEVVTPNLAEAAALTAIKVKSLESMRAAGNRLRELGARSVVVTGGHLQQPTDLLITAGGEQQYFGQHIQSRSTHGTGCAFATSLACNLALGCSVAEATLAAKNYVSAAIRRAYPVGKGTGPLHHLFRFSEQPK